MQKHFKDYPLSSIMETLSEAYLRNMEDSYMKFLEKADILAQNQPATFKCQQISLMSTRRDFLHVYKLTY